jgi:hypothetical protein
MVNNKGFTSGMEISASDSVAIESIVLPKSYVRYVKYILCLNCLVSLVFYGTRLFTQSTINQKTCSISFQDSMQQWNSIIKKLYY